MSSALATDEQSCELAALDEEGLRQQHGCDAKAIARIRVQPRRLLAEQQRRLRDLEELIVEMREDLPAIAPSLTAQPDESADAPVMSC